MKNNKQEKIELKEFEWEAPEFEKKEKSKSWFFIPAILTIILGIIALVTENILFLIFIILAFVIFYMYANKEPRILKFKINEKGIEVAERLYPLDTLRSFWLFYNPPEEKEISFRSKKTFFPYLRLPLAEQNPNEIREFLLKFLPEKKHTESIIDIFMRRIGF
jgi:hypothetical protein